MPGDGGELPHTRVLNRRDIGDAVAYSGRSGSKEYETSDQAQGQGTE